MRTRPVVLWSCLLVGCSERAPTDGSLLEGPVEVEAAFGADGLTMPVEPWSAALWPADVVSITYMVEAEGATLFLGARDGQGQLWTDPERPELSPNRALRGRDRVVGTWPVSSAALGLTPPLQVWARQVGTGPRARVTFWTKRGPGGAPPARQALSLALFLAGDGIADDHRLARALGEVGRIWRQVDIEVREPVRIRMNEAAPFRTVIIDPRLGSDSPALGPLLRTSTAAPAGSLPIFLVPELATSGGVAIWALSAGIPVPPVLGTARSGIVVSAELLAIDPVRAGQVLAHELGHALGLFHTTEGPLSGGEALHDGLDDTPACPTARDGDGDRVLTAGECEGNGADNLMFWSTGFGGTTLTRAQGEFARRSALVR